MLAAHLHDNLVCRLTRSGKSTALQGIFADIKLDGDAIRPGLSSDLGYTEAEKIENHRRIAEMAKVIYTQGFSVGVATLGCSVATRKAVRDVLGDLVLFEHINTPLDVCLQRDTKGVYNNQTAPREYEEDQ